MKISLIEIAGFKAAMRSMRFPHRSNDKSDSWFTLTESDTSELFVHDSDDYFDYFIGPKDMELSQKLIRAGDTHAKHMRGIIAWIEITAPDYWWDEMCTYEVGVTKLPSTSSMHCEFKDYSGEELQKLRSEQPRGFEYTRIYAISYQTLRHIHDHRRKHKLPEWRQFCDFIETLPLAKELITIV